MTSQTREIPNPNLKLHCEIIDFYNFIKPKEDEYNLRLSCFSRIKAIIEEELPDSRLLPFGSFATKLNLPSSDIDLVLIDKTKESSALLNKVMKVIRKHPQVFTSVEPLRHAKVPIIKFTEGETGIEFDISFNEEGGLLNIKEVERAQQVHPELKYLVFIVKLMLRQRRLHNPFSGGAGSFLVFCMVLAFLREYKRRQVKDISNIRVLERIPLSEYLLNFLSFYGTEFDYRNQEIVMTDGGYLRRKERSDLSFSMISPQDPQHNIGKQCFKNHDVFGVFRNRYNFLLNVQCKQSESILKHLINPSERKFDIYLS